MHTRIEVIRTRFLLRKNLEAFKSLFKKIKEILVEMSLNTVISVFI